MYFGGLRDVSFLLLFGVGIRCGWSVPKILLVNTDIALGLTLSKIINIRSNENSGQKRTSSSCNFISSKNVTFIVILIAKNTICAPNFVKNKKKYQKSV